MQLKGGRIMSKYCMSCGAANADAANVCTRCGNALAGGGMQGRGWTPPQPPRPRRMQGNGMLPLKYQIGGIAMFVCAGIMVLLMIILLANGEKYMFSALMHSEAMWNFGSLDQVKAIYIVSVIAICLISAGMYLHCGILLRRTQLRGKGVLIFYSILFGFSALTNLISLGSADQVTMVEILSLLPVIGACVLLIMKCYDFEMQKRGTYY